MRLCERRESLTKRGDSPPVLVLLLERRVRGLLVPAKQGTDLTKVIEVGKLYNLVTNHCANCSTDVVPRFVRLTETEFACLGYSVTREKAFFRSFGMKRVERDESTECN